MSYTLQGKLIVRIVHESRQQELHFMYIHFFSIISCFEDTSSFQWSLTLNFLEVTLEVVQLSVKNQRFFQNENSKSSIFFKNKVQTHEK